MAANLTGIVGALSSVLTSNPTAAGKLLNVLGNQNNGQAAATVLSMLAMMQANPDNASAIAAEIEAVPGVSALNIGPQLAQLPALAKDPTAFTGAIMSLENAISQSANSTLGNKLMGLL